MIDKAKAVAQRLRNRIHDSHMTVEIMCDESADVIDALVARVMELEHGRSEYICNLVAEIGRLTKVDVEPVAWWQVDQGFYDIHTKRLNEAAIDGHTALVPASTIAALRAENKRLREALKFYAQHENWNSPSTGFALQYDPIPSVISKERGAVARAALEGKK